MKIYVVKLTIQEKEGAQETPPLDLIRTIADALSPHYRIVEDETEIQSLTEDYLK